jgi:hypothetical protein
MNAIASGLLLAAMLFFANASHAQQPACKTTKLKNPAPTLAEMHAMADAHAKAWQPDAVLARMSTTTNGPLQPNGAAAGWSLVYFSESTKSRMSVDTFDGSLTCFASPGGAGRIPDLKPGFFRDGAKLYAIAKQHGESLIASGHAVMIGTAAAPRDRHATWNISYSKDGGKDGGVLVLVDANTGTVEKVLK